LTGLEERPAVVAVNEGGGSVYLLTCEHASNYIPAAYGGLGLPPADLQRHIAWDIGAAELARRLSARLDAPLFLAGCSRLLIDCNRPLGAPTSIVTTSEATMVPGNLDLGAEERAKRAARYFTPFHERIAAALNRRAEQGKRTIVVGVHSFTPVFHGVARRWQVGVLYGGATAFAHALIARLRQKPGCEVGDNEPYKVSPETDYTVPTYGDARGLDAVLIEVRQDLLGTDAGIEQWAAELAAALAEIAA